MADTAVSPLANASVTFTRQTLDVGATRVDIANAGQGRGVLYLAASSDPLAQILAADFNVHCFTPNDVFASLAPAAQARQIAAILEALALPACSVIAAGDDAQALLHLAADAPDASSNNIMVAPSVFDAQGVLRDPALADKLENITSHSLALFGTDSSGNATGSPSLYRQTIPYCHLMYVYDAPDPVRDRPQATACIIADFLRRGDGFLVNEKDGRIHA